MRPAADKVAWLGGERSVDAEHTVSPDASRFRPAAAHSDTSGRYRVRTSDLLGVSETAARSNQQEPQEVTESGADGCPPGCPTPAENAPDTSPVNPDFAAALAMIATLPLSAEEKAEAVRRLLGGVER